MNKATRQLLITQKWLHKVQKDLQGHTRDEIRRNPQLQAKVDLLFKLRQQCGLQ